MQVRTYSVLDRYIGGLIFSSIMITLFILVSLSGIIKFVDQLKKIGQGNYDISSAGIYTLLSIPKDIQVFLPMAALLGVLLGLGVLIQRSELIVMQASGYSQIQVSFSVIKIAVPVVLLIMVIGEWIAPKSEQMARNYRSQSMYGGSLLSTQQGLWAKDKYNFIHIEHVKSKDELIGVNIYIFDNNHHLQSIRYAAIAKFNSKYKIWCLLQVEESNLQNQKQIIGSKNVSCTWKTNLTPKKLSIVVLDPNALSISGLYDYIRYLKLSGQDCSRYQLNMWSKIFQPVLTSMMILMALSLIFGPLRSVPTGIREVTGIILGFFFYVLDHILSPLILLYGVSPIASALLPSILFLFISIWLLIIYS